MRLVWFYKNCNCCCVFFLFFFRNSGENCLNVLSGALLSIILLFLLLLFREVYLFLFIHTHVASRRYGLTRMDARESQYDLLKSSLNLPLPAPASDAHNCVNVSPQAAHFIACIFAFYFYARSHIKLMKFLVIAF